MEEAQAIAERPREGLRLCALAAHYGRDDTAGIDLRIAPLTVHGRDITME